MNQNFYPFFTQKYQLKDLAQLFTYGNIKAPL